MSYPTSPDGTPLTIPNQFPSNTNLFISGCSDDATLGRAKGPPFIMQGSTTVANNSFSWQYMDCVWLLGGDICYQNAVAGDSISFSIIAPASTVVANALNTGSVDVSNGMIIPNATHTGAYDLGVSVPVPASDSSIPTRYTGLWDMTLPANQLGAGIPVPNTTQTGAYHLITSQQTLVTFVSLMPILGSQLHSLNVPNIRPKQIWPQWWFSLQVNLSPPRTNFTMVWSMTVGRVKTT